MSAEGERSTLDGNAAGGLLREVFAFDATVAPTTCAGCGRTRPMAELMLYAVELGAILRCPSCDQAVVRIGRTPRGLWLDLRGATTVVAVATVVGVSAAFAGDLTQVHHRVQDVDGIRVFYREAGPTDAPTILLLHGFPTSSHMYRDLIPRLAARYRVIAPDYPGYGFSEAPSPSQFNYTFDHLAEIMDGFVAAVGARRYVLYAQDFGGPVGFRLAARRPERVAGLVIQNAVAHEEGLSEALNAARPFWAERTPQAEAPMRRFLTAELTRYQYLHGARDSSRISPDAWTHAQALLDRPGNDEIQLALLHDYGSNLKKYPEWQAYFRKHRPPALVVWGKNDPFFTVDGAKAYVRDMPATEMHLLEAGHFALEEEAPRIAELMLDFLGRRVFGGERE